MSGAATAGRRGAGLVDVPTATLGAGASVAKRGRADTDATRRFDPLLLDTTVLWCDGGTVLLFDRR